MAQPLFPHLKPVLLDRDNGPGFSLSVKKWRIRKAEKMYHTVQKNPGAALMGSFFNNGLIFGSDPEVDPH
jgi:hypothetical protein